jgi:hypothetical protein
MRNRGLRLTYCQVPFLMSRLMCRQMCRQVLWKARA